MTASSHAIQPMTGCEHLLNHRQADSLMGIALEGLGCDCLDDAEILFGVLQSMCAPSAKVCLMKAIVLIKRSQWDEAIRILDDINTADSQPGMEVSIKSFKAYCQMRAKDASWQRTAHEAWECGGSVRDLALVAILLKKSDQEIEMHATMPSSTQTTPEVSGHAGHAHSLIF